MTPVKVSVCIPAFNQVDLLKRALDSVLRQTYSNFEIVITDDSNEQDISALVETYNLPGKIKYFKNISRLGSPENWNESIHKATGEYIKILHHDDWLYEDASLAKYVSLLDDNPSADFAFSATLAVNPKGIDWFHKITDKEVAQLKEDPILLCTNNLIGAPSTTIFRKKSFQNFDPKLKWHVDIDNYIRQIGKNKNIVYSNEILVVTFIAEGRITEGCIGNKYVEVPEYLYLLNKMIKSDIEYRSATLNMCILRAINICREYKIKSISDIRECGFSGKVQKYIKRWIVINNRSELLGKAYLKYLRNKFQSAYANTFVK